jgi:hypothetical protein
MCSNMKRYHRLQGRFVARCTSEGTLFTARHPTPEPALNIYAKFFEVSSSGPLVQVSYKTMYSLAKNTIYFVLCFTVYV